MQIAATSSMLSLLLLGACASGVPADPPPLGNQQAVSGLVPEPTGFKASAGSGAASSAQSTAGTGSSSSASASTTFVGRPAAGSGGASAARGPECQKLACVDIFDCVFVYLGNKCAFTKCEAGVCN
jgi:hypothetical protein